MSQSSVARAFFRLRFAALVVLSGLAFVACFSEGSETPLPGGGGGRSGSGGRGEAGLGVGLEPAAGGEGGEIAPPDTFTCDDAEGEPLPARRTVTSDDGGGDDGGQTILRITKAQLFRDFERQRCGTSECHGGADEPLVQSPDNFRMTLESFDERPTLGTEALDRILSDNPDEVMPPDTPGGDGSTRGPENPVRILGERLLAWQEAGFPDSFEVATGGGPVNPELPEDPYLLSPQLGEKLTNIGSCVPRRANVLTLAEEEMEQKDALFATMSTSDELPDTLFETDLVSLESATLARRRVFSYAPTYTLFSDNAGKMRHLRVPLGETIHYDRAKKDFHIPDNTRFYKTFLKRVVDEDGNVGWRKMETRLIVVRNDEELGAGKYRFRALRAAYAWDRNETMARRVKDPLRNGEPAADRLCSYIVDETMTRDHEQNPISEDVSEFCTYMTADEMENPSSGKVRHYAIPGTDRCDQCHMGSSSHSYILGFNPWQVDRRPDGEGGVFEPPMGDELSQLARLIDYGVITGIEPGEAKLEESQGERSPRNDYELKAQAYMMGNCVFCHNPHGFPVVQNPVLAGFDLYPSETGGIFRFSLERYSPRAKAGKSQQFRFPYITPAFGDHVMGDGIEDTKVLPGLPPEDPPISDADMNPPDWHEEGTFTFLGPWRSLIWRNVYTPFTYEEDGTLFIHMPRNAPGHDCRAQKIMAEWMLSIPSLPKPTAVTNRGERERDQPVFEATQRTASPLQYREALAEAARNLERYARSVTGSQCPPDDDIVDPKVVLSPRDPNTNRPTRLVPDDDGYFSSPRIESNLPPRIRDSVPDHAHWVPTDLTEAPGKWVPRRRTWRDVIVTREVEVSEKLSNVIDDLVSVHLSPELKEFALEPRPMGIWDGQCQTRSEVSSFPTVEELASGEDSSFRRWMTGQVFFNDAARNPLDRVHFQSRGESVFRAICQNCHGRDADSNSPLSATIMEVTGGNTRVANFVAGLFGPATAPGAFARDEFLINRGATPEEWQARYLLFMGLGGTEATIPQIVLDLVATSPFYGMGVTAPGPKNANMLGSAEQLCYYVLGYRRFLKQRGGADYRPSVRLEDANIFSRLGGHYELWESLCAYENEPVVHVFGANASSKDSGDYAVYRAKDDSGAWIYPADAPVGNQDGGTEIGIKPGNALSWCVRARTPEEEATAYKWGDSAAAPSAPPGSMPFCPPALFTKALDPLTGPDIHKLAFSVGTRDVVAETPFGNQAFTQRWARKGAMNAGLAAYHYIRGRLTRELEPSLPFDFCRQ